MSRDPQDDADKLMEFQEEESSIDELPKVVRETLSLEDDPDVPVITFRYFILSILFIVPGAFLGTMNSYRTTSAPFSILLVQYLSHVLGKWLAKVLPETTVRIWGTSFQFSLNPGPWSIKESVLVTLTAASGATGNQGTAGLSLAEIFYGHSVSPTIAMLFMYAIVWTGYSYAAIARNFVLYEPQFVWPQALMQSALFKNQSQTEKSGSSSMKFFSLALAGMTVWEFFPEYIFPLTSSIAPLCYIAPHNAAVNFIGSGLGGMGFLNISLDWSNITSSVMLSPYWTIVVQFISFACGCWVLIPIFKWFAYGKYSMGLMSNHLLMKNGEIYPTAELITKDLKFNQKAYDHYGPVHLGAQRIWNIFFDYAAYVSALTWLLTFGWKEVSSSYRNLKSKDNAEAEPLLSPAPKGRHKVSSRYTDKVNRLYSVYEDVPATWFLVLFSISFVILMGILFTGQILMPWWCYIVALFFGAVIVIPMSYLFAVSNFQLAIGTFNELLYGMMIQKSDTKHPAGAAFYGAIAGNAWYRAQFMLQDQKIGMYNQIPPKAVFFSQIFGDLIGVPVNYAALKWIIKEKGEFLNGSKKDPLNQWTGQLLVNYNTNAILYVMLGPKRVFEKYRVLPYGFLFGLTLPLLTYAAYRWNRNKRFNMQFNLWNSTIICSSLSVFYGNISTGHFTKFLLGTFTMFYMYRYRHKLFARYNYILAAAFDTGYNLAVLLIFVMVSTGWGFEMPAWWGNSPKSVERCFAL